MRGEVGLKKAVERIATVLVVPHPDCHWVHVVTDCNASPSLTTMCDPAAQPWQPVKKVQHYTLDSSILPKEGR